MNEKLEKFSLYFEQFDIEVLIDLTEFEKTDNIIIHYNKEDLKDINEEEFMKEIEIIINEKLKKGIDLIKEGGRNNS